MKAQSEPVRFLTNPARIEGVVLNAALAWPIPHVAPALTAQLLLWVFASLPAAAGAAPAPEPVLNLFQEDRIVVSHPWGTGTTARGTFALEVTGADASEISFALRNDLREVDSKRTIPWSAISVTGSTDVKAGRVASFTITINEIPGPGRYPFTLYAQANGMSDPTPLALELHVQPAPELVPDARDQHGKMVTDGVYQFRFAARTTVSDLQEVAFGVAAAVYAEEDPSLAIQPSHVSVTLPGGAKAPDLLQAGQPLDLVMRVRVPGPGTYRIPLTMSAAGLVKPVDEEFVLLATGVEMSDHPGGYIVESVTSWPWRPVARRSPGGRPARRRSGGWL